MKTIEELEAELETLKRERDAHLRDAVKFGREYDEVSANWDRTLARLDDVTRERDLSLAAWEAAGMQGRDAQSAMLELARQLEEARAEEARLQQCWQEASDARSAEMACRMIAERACDAERTRRDEARETILALTTAKAEADLEIAALTAALDERDELLVRVANQDAELRATREAYQAAYRRGAEAMREACARIDPYVLHRYGVTYAQEMDTPASIVRVMQTAILCAPIPEEP